MRLVNALPSAATRIFMASLCLWLRHAVSYGARRAACLRSRLDVDQLEGLEARGLALARQAARLADHPCRTGQVIVPAMQMPMQPHVGQWQQIVVGIAEARRAGLRAEAR